MTGLRKSREEKDIFWSILKEIYWELWSMQPMKKMEKAYSSLMQRKKPFLSSLKLIYADSAYHRKEVQSTLEKRYDIRIEIVSTPRLKFMGASRSCSLRLLNNCNLKRVFVSSPDDGLSSDHLLGS